MTWLAVAAAAFAVSCAVTPLIRRAAIIDVPNERSSHATPTPRGGGIAILVATFAIAAAFGVFADVPLRFVAAGVILVAIVGFIDDVRSLGALPRFLTHCAAALLPMFFAGLVLERIDWIPLAMFGWPVTLVFLVGLTNAYNFMDGINGIAGLEAVVAATAMALLSLQANDLPAAVLALALAGASAGFLPWNFPKAKIFMGDVGSGAIGFLLGALVVRYASQGGSVIAAVLPLLPFVLDTAVTVVRRTAKGERFWAAHRSHFYQRLNSLGWSHTAVTLLWSAVAAAGALVAIAYARLAVHEQAIAVAGLFALQAAIAIAITRRELSSRKPQPR